MPPVAFEPTISAGERPQTYALDRVATGTGALKTYHIKTACTNCLPDDEPMRFETCRRLLVNKTNICTEFQFYWYYDSLWRHRFGGGFGPVVRQNTE